MGTVKGMGALLILAAAGMAALMHLRDKRSRLEGCRSVASALRLLRGELAARSLPLGEAVEHVQSRTKGLGKELMKSVTERLPELGEVSFQQIWTDALEGCCMILDPGALEELRGLGPVLGSFDLDVQLRSLEVAISYLEVIWEQQRGGYPAQRRLLLSLYLAMSCFLVILLL